MSLALISMKSVSFVFIYIKINFQINELIFKSFDNSFEHLIHFLTIVDNFYINI